MLIGPDIEHFRSVVEALVDAGAVEIVRADALGARMRDLLADDAARREIGAAGRRSIEAWRGASARHATILHELAGRRDDGTSDSTLLE